MNICSAYAIILMVIFAPRTPQRNSNFYFKLGEFLTHWYRFKIKTAIKVLSSSLATHKLKLSQNIHFIRFQGLGLLKVNGESLLFVSLFSRLVST